MESTVLVKDIIEGIENKSRPVQDVADMYGVHKKTISNRLVNLGFQYSKKTMKYDYVGTEDIDSVYAMDWESLMQETQRRAGVAKVEGKAHLKADVKDIPKASVLSGENQTASTIESTSESAGTSEVNIKPIPKHKQSKSLTIEYNDYESLDALDRLFAGEKNAGRIYRGFYFDADVLTVIDSVASGNKSEFVNQVMRKVFKEKGWC